MKKIDIFAHICPPRFIDAFSKKGVSWEKISGTAVPTGGPALWDMDKRLEVMDRYEDYVQLLVPSNEVIEVFFGPKDTPDLARAFNDEVAEIIGKYPDRFVGAVAALPMNNIDAALKEMDRTLIELGFKGILMHTPIIVHEKGRSPALGPNYETMKAIDLPEFMPIYESMSKHNKPIWLHPVGYGSVPVYSGEKRGKYQIAHILGWPIESAMAMSRLVCGGILAKYPNLKFITHHCGSGIIPALEARLDYDYDKYRAIGTLKWDEPGEKDPFKSKRPIEYFRSFYADTAIYGGASALECGHSFFGAERMVFGTDFPFDTVNGDRFIEKTIDAVHRMNISDGDKELIFQGNAKRILHLDMS